MQRSHSSSVKRHKSSYRLVRKIWQLSPKADRRKQERVECSISKDVFTCMYVCFTVFVYFVQQCWVHQWNFQFLVCDLSVFPPPFQFPLDEVGLQPLVLWYTKNSFTSLHGKCSVIHKSNAGNARHLYLSLCYESCCAMLNCRMTPVLSFDVFLLCDCLPCTGHSLGLVQSWMFKNFYYYLLLRITRFWFFAYMTDYEELKMITFNTNGLSDFRKRKDVLDFLRKQKGNIFL